MPPCNLKLMCYFQGVTAYLDYPCNSDLKLDCEVCLIESRGVFLLNQVMVIDKVIAAKPLANVKGIA